MADPGPVCKTFGLDPVVNRSALHEKVMVERVEAPAPGIVQSTESSQWQPACTLGECVNAVRPQAH